MNKSRIRGFLLRTPKPHAVRITRDDGSQEVLAQSKGFNKLAETIEALDVVTIECLDAKGSITRATRLDDDDVQRSAAATIPKGLEEDPNALMVAHIADVIHRAYEHSTEIAFNRLIDLVERMGDRAEATEARLERVEAAHRRTVQEQIDEAWERAEEAMDKAEEPKATGNPFVDNMIASFMSGQMQGARKAPAAAAGAKANGAAPPKGQS